MSYEMRMEIEIRFLRKIYTMLVSASYSHQIPKPVRNDTIIKHEITIV